MIMLYRIFAFVIISWATQEIVKLVAASSSHDSSISDAIDMDLIRAKCSEKFDFKTIREFQTFAKEFNQLDAAAVDPQIGICLSHKSALMDLKELVDNYDRKRPCKHSEVIKLDQYAKKHFMVKKQRPWTMKFFTLFGVNLGLRCKLNLLAHLKQAETEVDPLDFIYSMASPTGWDVLINEHSKKTMKFGTSSNAGNSVINRVAKLVPGLTLVEHLDFLQFDHALNKLSSSGVESGVESVTHELGSSETAVEVRQYVDKIVASCQSLDQFYYNSILSLARLNELGLLVQLKLVDDMHESSLMLHRWLAAASFCQIMVRVQVETVAASDQRHTLQLRIIHDDSKLESRRTLYSYVADFDEISEEARQSVWLASVADGKWLRKDQAMFRDPAGTGADSKSVAMLRLQQFIKGLERDYTTWTATKGD